MAGNVRFTADSASPITFSVGDDVLIVGGDLTMSDAFGTNDVNMTVADDFRVRDGCFVTIKGGSTVTSQDLFVGDTAATATLNGTLDVVLLNPFFPTPGETFEIMTFVSHSGEFATVSGDVGLLDSTTFLLPLYSGTNLLLFTAIPGDGNLNGSVEAADYTVWANGFGAGTVFTDGDYNGDGATTAADYTLWANNFGMMVASPAGAAPTPAAVGAAQSAAVPEPSTLVLLLIGAIALLWRRS